jgi:hypothetical protein
MEQFSDLQPVNIEQVSDATRSQGSVAGIGSTTFVDALRYTS